jgi:hypothetical protein
MGDPDDGAGGPGNLVADDPDDAENLMFGADDNAEIIMPDDRTVNYVFPVEVIVIGALTDDDYRAIERRIWTDFGEAWTQQSI